MSNREPVSTITLACIITGLIFFFVGFGQGYDYGKRVGLSIIYETKTP